MPNFLCKKCSGTSFYLQQKGNAIGMYCDTCGSWSKWVGKKDVDMFKRRGLKVYPQNVKVEVKGIENMGVTYVESMPKSMGVESTDGVPFDADTDEKIIQTCKNITEKDIEQEVEKRVQKRLKEIEKTGELVKERKEESGENASIEYCPYCDGEALKPDGNSKVEVTIFSGVLTVTDPEGLNIYGMYRLKRCPMCGKIFK